MPENLDAIYQSGEKVPFNATFEVVGVSLAKEEQSTKKVIRHFTAGEVFVYYQGYEVCWHLVVVQ
jgi:hypothetical protein